MRVNNTSGNRAFMCYDIFNSHGWAVGVKGNDATNKGLYFNNAWQFAGTDILTLLNNGNVGIGINPYTKFTIRDGYGDGANGGLCLDASDSSNTYNLKIYSFVQAGGQVGYYFQVNNISSSVNALTLGYSGNVGIGTASPNCKLHVYGAMNISGASPYAIPNGYNTGAGCVYIIFI
jgi:hypothetical protein